MNRPVSHVFAALSIVLTIAAGTAVGQPFEAVGERALGMGGAFVAVANDGSATWWNPAGLATGPFLDLAISRTTGAADADLPASRSGVWGLTVSTPPLGVSYYRLRITGIQAKPSTAEPGAGREDRAAGVGIRSLSVSQFGATVLHTITTGVSAGATVKYVRGTPHRLDVDASASLVGIPELLDVGDELEDGDGQGTVDLDLGVLAAVGALRAGATVRNLREPRFGDRQLSRQIRAGGAFDGTAAGMMAVMVSVDVDLRRYAAETGDRRVIAVGAEHWVRPRRFAVRGGARVNTVGQQDRTVTVGASVAPRAGMFVDGHAAYGSNSGESGWGIAARVSF